MQPNARSLEQIMSELGSVYDPQVASLRQRQSLIPQQIQAEEQGLQAKQTQAFDDILGGARRRGLGFSGIPLAEQARYTSTEYLPALARLRQSGREQAMSLEDAILGIQERRTNQAQGIYQTEQDRAEQARQFNMQQRAAAAQRQSFANLFNQPPPQPQQPASQIDPQQQRDFNFVKNLIERTNSGDGVLASTIIRQAREGSERSKEIMRAFYQLQNKPIPANFRSFL